MRFSVVLGQWLDRPLDSDLRTAQLADHLGYDELWVPEMAKADAPAMAAWVVSATRSIQPTLGPLAVTVRSPVQIAMALSTLSASGRPVGVALGTSSSVVARWHGRSRADAAAQLERTRAELAALLSGERINGYRLPTRPEPTPPITVAAFGPKAVEVAKRADRLVLNMVTTEAAAGLAGSHPRTAVWLCGAVDPTDEELAWLARGLVGYLGAPGYGEMFAAAGYGDLVEFARTRPDPKEIHARMPPDLIQRVALVGTEREIRDRVAEYARAGISEIAIVPAAPDLPSAAPTLELFSGI